MGFLGALFGTRGSVDDMAEVSGIDSCTPPHAVKCR